jgi:nitroimidazol reductase NimA-like FMN-containing flavoprotein (pyridoxamine 5'-phosphate oxidase superfamily)
VLSDGECRRLLAQTKVGRVVISVSALPAALPVNYRLIDGSILFFTGQGMKLHAALQNSVVGFEVDSIDEESETGWSVLAVGHATEISDTDMVATAKQAGLRPWADGDRNRLISINPQLVSGRRLSHLASAITGKQLGPNAPSSPPLKGGR